jgi:hypothetical protein
MIPAGQEEPMPRCPSCNRDNPPGVELCKNCGASLPDQPPQPPAASADSTSDHRTEQDGGLEGQVLPLLREGRKIQAIKLYRERTGRGLKEAKDAVELLADQHGIESKQAGCAGVILAALAVCGTLIAAFS